MFPSIRPRTVSGAQCAQAWCVPHERPDETATTIAPVKVCGALSASRTSRIRRKPLSTVASHADARGSVWRRWDPHIHTPGTVLNDEFGGEAAWDEYLARIERADPRIEALGITDYASIYRYEPVVAHKAAGRLPDVGVICP